LWWRIGTVCVIASMVMTLPSLAQESEGDPSTSDSSSPSPAESDGDASHLFDLGISRLDTPLGDTITTLLGYTKTFRGNMSFSAAVTVNYAEITDPTSPDATTERHTGLGDTVLIYSFVPGHKINAYPWVPKSVGLSAALIVPTGSAENALGGDQFVLIVHAGWVYLMSERFSLLPAVVYAKSFAHGDLAIPISQLSGTLGLVWAHDSGWWLDYSGEVFWDFNLDDWAYNDTFSVGKMLSRRIGLSLAYGVLGSLDPNAVRNDNEWMVLFHYVMPSRSTR